MNHCSKNETNNIVPTASYTLAKVALIVTTGFYFYYFLEERKNWLLLVDMLVIYKINPLG